MTSARKSVAVALSGGVDSTTTSALLIEQGFEVIGLFMDLGPDQAPARRAAEAAADFLKIPLTILDLAATMDRRIIQPWLDGYSQGLTPNPCAECNREVKFRELLAQAQRLGATYLATGHYARIQASGDEYHLKRGLDPFKEQSYFLARLKIDWLERIIFPLGEMTKAQVRAKAAELNLPPADRADSQEVCFLAGRDYREFFLERRRAEPGEIILTNGQVLGRHLGLYRHTVGQRRGLNIPWSEPLYVISLDASLNQLIVGPKSALEIKKARLEEANWFLPPQELPRRVQVQVRYRAPALPAKISLENPQSPLVEFETPVLGLAPGQLGVIYAADRVLGSGWLARA